MARLFLILLIALVVLSAGCRSSRRYMLSYDKYPPTPETEDVRLYVNEVQRPHVEVAHVQSYADRRQDNETKRQQLESLKAESRRIGAHAVVNVRQMKNKVRGAVVDEAVPFRAYRQGEYELYFLRGTAIRFIEEDETALADPEIPAAELTQETEAPVEVIPRVETRDPEADLPMQVVPRGLGP